MAVRLAQLGFELLFLGEVGAKERLPTLALPADLDLLGSQNMQVFLPSHLSLGLPQYLCRLCFMQNSPEKEMVPSSPEGSGTL